MPTPSTIRRLRHACVTAAALFAVTAQAQSLRIGLAEDPDVLDPAFSRSFVGRVVFASLCDKLLDIDDKLNIVPQLATSWQWSPDNKALTLKLRNGVTFHDGEKFDAAAVKFNLERDKNAPGSMRRGDLAPMTSVDVVDPMTVRLNLSAPFSPLLSVLADRAGMMVSPKAAQASPAAFGSHPVCAGPFSFVRRVAQDRIELQRFPNYWNKDAIHIEKLTYLPIADATVRLANLRSGQLDMIERAAPSDLAGLKKDTRFTIGRVTELGYQAIYINQGKNAVAQKTALSRDPRVREAFELALDRAGVVQVGMEGEAEVGNQWVSPGNRYYAKNVPVPARNVARAKALLKEAGIPAPVVTLMTPINSDSQRVAQIVQAMTKEAGFDVKIQATEFATALDRADRSDFDAYLLPWSGRADPDGNLYSFVGCKQPLNYAGYCNAQVDDLLNRSRSLQDPAARLKVFEQIAAQTLKDRPLVYLYHRRWNWVYTTKLTGFKPVPDGMIRIQGLKMM